MWKLPRDPTEKPWEQPINKAATQGADSPGNDVLFDRKPDEIGGAPESEHLLQMGLVAFDRPDRDVELGRDLLQALALRQQAQHFALSRREFAFRGF
jgi:hypothetical protein